MVFSMNTVIGFACVIGIDMGFNSSHHHSEKAAKSSEHVHADGKKHVHHHETSNHHDQAGYDHHKAKDGADNCCHDKVTQLAQLDKSVPQTLTGFNPVFLTTLVSAYYNIDVFSTSQVSPDIKYFVRSYHPPIPDIRLAIQSFQI